MNDAERAFPVLLDPTVTETNLNSTELSATYISQGFSGGTAQGSGIYVGDYGNDNGMIHSIFHINKLIDIPDGSELVEARFGLAQTHYLKKNSSSSSELEIGLYPMTSLNGSESYIMDSSGWSNLMNGLAWTYVYDANNAYYRCAEGTPMADKVTVSSDTVEEYVIFNITRLAQSWYADEGANLGFMLRPVSDTADSRATFCGPKSSANRPVFMVFYTNMEGIESYRSYETISVGRAGTSYIADYTLQNTMVVPILSSESNVAPFSLSLIYNSAHATEYFTSGGTINTRNFSTMQVAAGWKLSVQETITPVSVDGTTYLVYNDADGTEHFFYYSQEEQGYIDENGLNLKITSGSTAYTLTDEIGNTKTFTYGYLTHIKDVHGNYLYICYNGNDYSENSSAWKPNSSGANKITSVYRGTLGSTPGKLMVIGYNGNRVSTIVGECDFSSDTEKAKRRTTLSVTEIEGKDCLTQISYSDGAAANYSYYGQADTNYVECRTKHKGLMASAYDAEANYGLEYSYSYNLDVRNLYEFVMDGDSKVYGHRMHGYKRNHNQVVFRYYGDDGISETADDQFVFKSFDNFGRTVGSFTTDSTERKILGVSAASYTENSGTNKTNNRLLGSISSGYQGIDLLINGGGEKGTEGWTGGISETTNVLYGAKAFKVASSSLTQQVSLSANVTYTFSAYVNVPDNASAYLQVVKGTNTYESETVDYSTAGVNGGWTRLTLSFPAESGGTYTCSLISTGTVYADALQLEQEQAASTYNLLENGTFEASGSSISATTDAEDWNITPGEWRRIGTAGFATGTDSYFGGKALSITGDASRHHVIQRVDMDREAGSTFLVSAWAKSTADPDSLREKETVESPYFGIFVRLRYADQTEEVQFFSFDPLYDGWQLRQGIVAPKEASANKAITDIIVALAYDHNFNIAIFDNVSLRLEPSQTYYYDEDGNLKSAAQVGTGTEEAEYDENGIDLKKYTSANGTTFDYTYNDAHDVLTAVSDGVTANYTYDSAGNMTKTTLTGGDLTMESSATMTPDHNHTESVTDAADSTTSYEYDDHRELLTKVTDAKDGVTEYEYDEKNDRPTKTTQISDTGTILASISYAYANGRLSTLTRTSGPKSQSYSFVYNLWGQSTSVKVGSYTLASYTYEDLAGNPEESGGGNLLEMAYGNGNSVSYFYDEFDRLIRMLYNDTGRYVEYVYNAEGSLAEMRYKNSSNAVISAYAFEYDSLGRLIRSAERNANGIVQRTEHIYDAIGRLSSQSWVIGTSTFSESYSYNDPAGAAADAPKDGSLKSMTTATGATIDYDYDHLKRLDGTTVTLPGTDAEFYSTAYIYQDRDDGKTTPLIKNFAVRSDSTDFVNYCYAYDALGNISAIYEGCDEEGEPGRVLFSYEYDDQNQLIKEKHYSYIGANTTAVVTTYTYTYDAAGNILSETRQVMTATKTKAYTYSTGDWKDLLTEFNGNSIAYEGQIYDKDTNTVSGTVTSGNPVSYYNGTRWEMEWQHGRQLGAAQSSTLTTDTALGYDYDADGIRTRKTYTVDTYEASVQHTVTFIADSRTVDVITVADGYVLQSSDYPNVPVKIGYRGSWIKYTSAIYEDIIIFATYKENGGGIIIPGPIVPGIPEIPEDPEEPVSVEPAAASDRDGQQLLSTSTVQHDYITQNGKVVRETVTTDGTVTAVMDFVYDESGRPFALIYTNGTAEPATYYYILNLQGDVVKMLDENGTTVASYAYNAWGEILSSSGTMASINPLRYRGYYYDSEIGFYYVTSRYYDPEIRRWINADGFIPTEQDTTCCSIFAYCENNLVSPQKTTGQFRIAGLAATVVVADFDVTFPEYLVQPTSDVGAAQPYVDMRGSDDPTSPNCYAYAIGSPVNEQPGKASGRTPTNWSDVYDVGKSVEADLKAKGYTVRKISGPNAKVYNNEFKIALRVGTQPYGYNMLTGKLYYDYHFMRQTSTGQWAEKHGYGGDSVLWGAGMTPDTIPWTLGGVPYYDSDIIYYAVGK